MTFKQFIDALDRHGSALDHWPATTRAGARHLLAESAAAREALAEADRVERFIRANDPGANVGADAMARLSNAVMARLPAQHPRPVPGRWSGLVHRLGLAPARLIWVPRFALPMAVAAILGLLAGNQLPTAATQQLSTVELLAMSDSYLPMDLR